jgi:hypothetical protein
MNFLTYYRLRLHSSFTIQARMMKPIEFAVLSHLMYRVTLSVGNSAILIQRGSPAHLNHQIR